VLSRTIRFLHFSAIPLRLRASYARHKKINSRKDAETQSFFNKNGFRRFYNLISRLFYILLPSFFAALRLCDTKRLILAKTQKM
jgi:hypothetical protein